MSSTTADTTAAAASAAAEKEAEAKKAVEDAKDTQMGFGSSFIEWFPCVVYVILYVVLDVLIASEGHTDPITNKRQYRYTAGVLVLLGEVGKLIVSVILLLVNWHSLKKKAEEGPAYNRLNDGEETQPAQPPPRLLDWRLGIYYVIPAVLYTVWNVVNYISLLYVSLSIYSIIYQSVLFFSAFLWSVTFNKKLTWLQWFALTLLAAGVFVVHLKIPFKVHFELSALWVLLQAFISAVASVYNEFLYKRPEEKHSTINQQNTYLYSFTTFCSFFYLMATEGPAIFIPSNFFRGFAARVVVIVIVSICLGLSVSLILKHRNVIVKLYAQAIHSPLEVLAAHIFLDTELTAMIIVASLLIGVSTYLYYRPQKPAEPPKTEPTPPPVAPAENQDPVATDKPDPQPSLWDKSREKTA